MDITIEKAVIEDALKMIEVQNESFKPDYDLLGEDAWRLTVWSKEKMEERITNHFAYKILYNSIIIGHFIIKEWKDGEYFILILCIEPQYQNMGVGTKTIKFIEQEFSYASRLTLTTPKQKQRNCYFYEKHGFIRVFEKVVSETYTDVGYVKEMVNSLKRI